MPLFFQDFGSAQDHRGAEAAVDIYLTADPSYDTMPDHLGREGSFRLRQAVLRLCTPVHPLTDDGMSKGQRRCPHRTFLDSGVVERQLLLTQEIGRR
ncbi:MAG: hypothetical protein IJ228_12915 [Succinivibrio sp.]|nr:hypothetical protein [Succinivibrio sp.]